MNRFDFYFKQPVSEAEFDGAFDEVEHAIWNALKDRGIFGIISGFVPTAPGAWNLAIASGKGIDKNGARLVSGGTITLDPRTATDGSSCIPTATNRRWVSIYARFGRNLSDARTDGLGAPIKFVHAEALNPDDTQPNVGKLLVVKGTEDLIINPIPVRPALDASAILLADVLITDGDASLAIGAIDVTRAERLSAVPAQWAFPAFGTYNFGGSKFVLLSSQPITSTIRGRMYAEGNVGLCFTMNAVWDPIAETWSEDSNVVGSSKVSFRHQGIFLHRRTTVGPWTETVGTLGWDGELTLTCPSADNYLHIAADSDMITKGSQVVYWAIGGSLVEAGSPVSLFSSVSFPKRFAAAPSSVVFSTAGMLSDSLAGGTIVLSVHTIRDNGAGIQLTPAGGCTYASIERNIVATY